MTEAQNSLQQRIATYQAAAKTLSNWVSGAYALSLLKAALDSGILEAARTPQSLDNLSQISTLEPNLLPAFCQALVAYEIFQYDEASDKYELTPTSRILSSPDSAFPFEYEVSGPLTKAKLLQNFGAASSQDYWNLDSADRIALAGEATVNPTSSSFQEVTAYIVNMAMPELLTAYGENGGQYLELGCGVGGGLLSSVYRHPKLFAVGVDKSADVIEVAKKKAAEIGVVDRVEWRVMDAAEIQDKNRFDWVFWAQPYFSAESRQKVLKAALEALKPSKFLYAPMGGNSLPQSPNATIDHLFYKISGVPEVTMESLRQEMEDAGFEFVRFVNTPLLKAVLMKRPA